MGALKKVILPVTLLIACNTKVEQKLASNFETVVTAVRYNKFDIKSLNKKTDTSVTYYKLFEKECDKWTLSREQIGYIFLNSKPIDGTYWDLCFSNLPCTYDGMLTTDSTSVSFTINAGAYACVKLKDSTLLLGYFGKDTTIFIANSCETDSSH